MTTLVARTARRHILLPVLLAIMVLLPGAGWAQDTGVIEVVLTRSDDQGSGRDPFGYELVVELNVAVAVPSVTLQIDSGTLIDLEQNVPTQDDEWNTGASFSTLGDLTTAVDGLWTLTVEKSGETDAVSTFTVSASSLVDGDIYPTATFTQPENGDTPVASDVNLIWTDPTGASTADVLTIEVQNKTFSTGSVDQRDDSVMGSLSEQDTMWDPPMDLSPGSNQPTVGYFEADEARITAIVVTQGSISWQLSPFAPAGYPTDKPLLALGSEATIAFGVSVVEDFEVYPDQTDTTGSSIPDGGGGFVTIYATTTGGTPTDPRVASVSESLASGTDNAIGRWDLESQAGTTGSSGGENGFVLIGDLPSLSDAPTAGPFSDFFGPDPTNRDRKDMAGSSVRVTGRQVVASPEPTDFRLLMFDDAGNASATALTAVDNVNTSFSFPESAFSIPVGAPADKTRVTGIAVELFTTPGDTVNLILSLDEVAIDFVPEPDATLLMLAALSTLGTLGGIARSRGKRAKERPGQVS